MAFILLIFIYKLFTNINDLLKKTTKVTLSSREHKVQEVLSVSAVATFPSNIAAPRRGSLQGIATHSLSGLILIASTMEGKAFLAEGRFCVTKLQVQT